MESENRKVIRLSDIFLIAIILCIALLFLFIQKITSKDGTKVIVMQDGEFIHEFLISENLHGDNALRIVTPYGVNVLEIKSGEASVIEADCPDGLCVKQKAISKQGESIICLPHKLVITVESDEESEIDSFAY